MTKSTQTLALAERLRRLWCRCMHDSPMWPIHGEYECRICLRRFEVPWAERPNSGSTSNESTAPSLRRLRPLRNP